MARALFPRIKRRLWRRNDPAAREADGRFELVRKRILLRDGYRCQYCGFRSETQDVHHIDDDQSNNEPSNLETVCPLCHSLFSLGQVGLSGHGKLAYLPELSRQDANHLQRTIAMVLDTGGEQEKAQARALLVHLGRRVEAVQEAFGTADAAVFGECLLRLDEERYAAVTHGDHIDDYVLDESGRKRPVRRDTAMCGLTLLFHPRRFERYLTAWRKVYAAVPLSTWRQIVRAGDAADHDASGVT
ncbi:MAG: HNH endonuclease [Pseudomonadota bacterium]